MYYKEDFLSLSLWSWWLLWVSLIYPQRLKKKERRKSSQGSLKNLIKHFVTLYWDNWTPHIFENTQYFVIKLYKKWGWLRRIYNFSKVLAYHQLKIKLLKYAKTFLSPFKNFKWSSLKRNDFLKFLRICHQTTKCAWGCPWQ